MAQTLAPVLFWATVTSVLALGGRVINATIPNMRILWPVSYGIYTQFYFSTLTKPGS